MSTGRTKILERINALNNMDTDPTQEQERDRSDLVRDIQQASGAAASTGAIPKHGFSHISREKSIEEIPQPKPQSTKYFEVSTEESEEDVPSPPRVRARHRLGRDDRDDRLDTIEGLLVRMQGNPQKK